MGHLLEVPALRYTQRPRSPVRHAQTHLARQSQSGEHGVDARLTPYPGRFADSSHAAHLVSLGCKRFLPCAEHQPRPKMRRSVVVSALVLIPNLSKKSGVQNSVVRIKERFLRHFAQLLAEPLAQRNGEPLLAAAPAALRQDKSHGLLTDIIPRAPISLSRRGDFRHLFRQLVVT